MVESSPVLFSAFLASFFVSSAQDSGKASRKKHNKCLPVIFLMMVRPVDDTVKKNLSHIEKIKRRDCQVLWRNISLYIKIRDSRTSSPVNPHFSSLG